MALPLITDPVDLLLGPDNDLVIQNGSFVFARGVPGVAQLVRIAIQMVAGEWFLNLAAGVKWFANENVALTDAILGTKYSPIKARKEIRNAILGVQGVASLDVLETTFDTRTRTLSVSWQVTTAFGDTISDSLTQEGNNS